MTLAQMGFFDLSDRHASPDAKRDPLVEIDANVALEEFRTTRNASLGPGASRWTLW